MSKSNQISVIVPRNPFIHGGVANNHHCLCAMNVKKLIEWWPGLPHSPHRNPAKVKSIQRSLDWKRVCEIAAYLLQKEIVDAPEKIDKYFKEIYQPKKTDQGREWPPKVNRVVGFKKSNYPTFSNILIHVNGAKIENANIQDAAYLTFNETDKHLNFSVIDGQHRINGAYLAISILNETDPKAEWEIPAEVFLDLDPLDGPPRKQAQIFIDVNFYQKKVDKSLVADLFPTARENRDPLDYKERAQDIGRKLMLEVGPLVGMIQIPGIKYGVKDVITLATLNSAVEDVIEILENRDLTSLYMQTEFIAQGLQAWLEASGRFHQKDGKELDPDNVAYQGRILVSIINLIPAMIWKLELEKIDLISDKALVKLKTWFVEIASNAGLLKKGIFISKTEFKSLQYLGSGGISRFRDSLWASMLGKNITKLKDESIAKLAEENRAIIWSTLNEL